MHYDDIDEILSNMPKRSLTDTERKQAFNGIVQAMTGDRRGSDLPTASMLNGWLAEIYPDAEHAPVREDLFGKLKGLATKNGEGADRIALRQRGNELFTQVEAKLADDDRLLPAKPAEEIDAAAIADSALVMEKRYGFNR